MGPQRLRGKGRTLRERLRRSSLPWSWDVHGTLVTLRVPTTDSDRRGWSRTVTTAGDCRVQSPKSRENCHAMEEHEPAAGEQAHAESAEARRESGEGVTPRPDRHVRAP